MIFDHATSLVGFNDELTALKFSVGTYQSRRFSLRWLVDSGSISLHVHLLRPLFFRLFFYHVCHSASPHYDDVRNGELVFVAIDLLNKIL